MKGKKNIIKATMAIVSTLFVASAAMAATDITLTNGIITKAVWDKINGVFQYIDIQEAGVIKITNGGTTTGINLTVEGKVCYRSGATVNGTNTTVADGAAITTEKWTNLQNVLNKMSYNDGTKTITMTPAATTNELVATGQICWAGPDKDISTTADNVCLNDGECIGD
ncbi:MAG: hypothetical protein N4A38_00575 [Candidatus Gracilibacteria bacterium]|nr:hypothetical protein [Candidatus Gracilibacteria bacterium]